MNTATLLLLDYTQITASTSEYICSSTPALPPAHGAQVEVTGVVGGEERLTGRVSLKFNI